MSTNFEHSVSFPFSAKDYWDLVSSEQYWRELLAATNSDHGRLESLTVDGDEATVVTHQGVSEENLPKALTAVRPGDVEIPRTCVFKLSGDTVIGRMEATVNGAPAKITGDIIVSGDPASVQYTGAAEVSIPFVGGRVEKAIIEQIVHLLNAEHDATVDFHQG